MFQKYLNFSGKNIKISSSEVLKGTSNLVIEGPPETMGLAQIVYRAQIQGKDLVVKILRDSKQEIFKLQGENEFTDAEFYYKCLEAIKMFGARMPDFYDVINLENGDDKNILTFLQTYIPGNLYDDRRQKSLPNLGLIRGSKKAPGRCFQEWFYSEKYDDFFFLDWDKYLLQLKNIAEKSGVKTREDLNIFCTRIKNSF